MYNIGFSTSKVFIAVDARGNNDSTAYADITINYTKKQIMEMKIQYH